MDFTVLFHSGFTLVGRPVRTAERCMTCIIPRLFFFFFFVSSCFALVAKPERIVKCQRFFYSAWLKLLSRHTIFHGFLSKIFNLGYTLTEWSVKQQLLFCWLLFFFFILNWATPSQKDQQSHPCFLLVDLFFFLLRFAQGNYAFSSPL